MSTSVSLDPVRDFQAEQTTLLLLSNQWERLRDAVVLSNLLRKDPQVFYCPPLTEAHLLSLLPRFWRRLTLVTTKISEDETVRKIFAITFWMVVIAPVGQLYHADPTDSALTIKALAILTISLLSFLYKTCILLQTDAEIAQIAHTYALQIKHYPCSTELPIGKKREKPVRYLAVNNNKKTQVINPLLILTPIPCMLAIGDYVSDTKTMIHLALGSNPTLPRSLRHPEGKRDMTPEEQKNFLTDCIRIFSIVNQELLLNCWNPPTSVELESLHTNTMRPEVLLRHIKFRQLLSPSAVKYIYPDWPPSPFFAP